MDLRLLKFFKELFEISILPLPKEASANLILSTIVLNSFSEVEKKESTDLLLVKLKCFSITLAPIATADTDAIKPLV